MGEAKRRGTREERVAAAQQRELEARMAKARNTAMALAEQQASRPGAVVRGGRRGLSLAIAAAMAFKEAAK